MLLKLRAGVMRRAAAGSATRWRDQLFFVCEGVERRRQGWGKRQAQHVKWPPTRLSPPWHHTIQPNPSALPLSVVTTTDPGAPAILRASCCLPSLHCAGRPARRRAGLRPRGAPPEQQLQAGVQHVLPRLGSGAGARAHHCPRRSCLYLTVATQKRKPARMDGPAFLASAGGA